MTRLLALMGLLVGAVVGCAPVEPKTDIFGYLEGHVKLGPICPVDREGVPCPVPPEAYAAREIWIYQGQQIVARAHLSDTGNYWIALSPGSYGVDINRIGMDSSPDLPRRVHIQAGETVRLDIAIDTGIR